MKICPAALPVLILAVALGPPAHASLPRRSRSHGVHRPGDCCFFYTPRTIRCAFMQSYYRTSSGCPQPGIIFTPKMGYKVCADPYSKEVKDCMEDLDSAKKQRKTAG